MLRRMSRRMRIKRRRWSTEESREGGRRRRRRRRRSRISNNVFVMSSLYMYCSEDHHPQN
jgi:hypothetical protein